MDFDKISYKRFCGISKNLYKYNDYEVISESNNECVFRLGQGKYKIIPILTTVEGLDKGLIQFFGQKHPSGINVPEITDTLKLLDIKETILIDNKCTDQFTPIFKLGFKYTGILCDKLGGKLFLNSSKNNTVLWFVIMEGLNKLGKDDLQTMIDEYDNITDEEIYNWNIMIS